MARLTQAIGLYLTDKEGQRLSPNTLNDYRTAFKKLVVYMDDDPPIEDIDHVRVRGFFSLLAESGIKKKTQLNHFCALSSLWTWAVDERGLCSEHVLRRIRPPRAERTAIQPFSQREVTKILGSLGESRSFTRRDGDASKPRDLDPIKASRNRAIVLFLLDSGLRASELCGLKVKDIQPGERGVYLVAVSPLYAKESRGRTVVISSRTWETTLKYLDLRDNKAPESFLFYTDNGKPLTRDALRQMLEQLTNRCGLSGIHAHKFRHTFAVNFLRNGGDIFTLQAILGHSTLDMVKRYLALAQADLERNHAKASPVVNWEL